MKKLLFNLLVMVSTAVSTNVFADDPDGRLAAYDANVQLLRECIASEAFTQTSATCIRLTIPVCEERGGERMSRMDLAGCFYDELRIWEGFYSEALLGNLFWAQRFNDDAARLGMSLNDAFTNILIAEAAWQDYRKKECVRENDRWGGGTAAGIGAPYCHMRLLAERVHLLSELDLLEVGNED